MPNSPDTLLQRVLAEARALNIPVSSRICPRVTVNRRAVTRFGLCHRKGDTFTIEVNERLLTAPEFSLRQTLAHEVLHTCPGCANHGPLWKSYAAQMNAACGYQIRRTDECAALGIPEMRKAKYFLRCSKCGKILTRQRKSALILHPERYRCRCGGKLIPTESEAAQ